jgi:hypothetical protein
MKEVGTVCEMICERVHEMAHEMITSVEEGG